ncbi:MAG: helix-turn-helix domain-containing protein [Verrucomicrobiales bacterium]
MPICDFALELDRKYLTTRHLQRKNLLQNPTSLGTHLRNRRLLAGQTQRQAATQMGVLREVYDRWERDETEPPVGFWKRIIAFLGYYPTPQNGGRTRDLVLMARRVHSLSQYALGRNLGVIAKTVRLWEHGLAEPDPTRQKRLRALARACLKNEIKDI